MPFIQGRQPFALFLLALVSCSFLYLAMCALCAHVRCIAGHPDPVLPRPVVSGDGLDHQRWPVSLSPCALPTVTADAGRVHCCKCLLQQARSYAGNNSGQLLWQGLQEGQGRRQHPQCMHALQPSCTVHKGTGFQWGPRLLIPSAAPSNGCPLFSGT